MKNPISAETGAAKPFARRSLFLAAPGAGVLLAQSLAAQTPAAPAKEPVASGAQKIGILQAQLALLNTKDGQAAQAELQKKLGPKADSINKQRTDLNDLQKKLDQGGNTMSAATKQDLQNSIQSKTKTLNRDVQDFQDEEQAEENRVLADLEEKMKAVIEKYAVDNGFSLIINAAPDNSPILWASAGLDITKEIIEAYDKAAPPVPKAPAVAHPTAPARPPATASPKPPAAAPKQ